MATPEPIARAERVRELDVLRGFALCGVLVVNMEAFSGFAFMAPPALAALPHSGRDPQLQYLLGWLAIAKFYSLFSFLFGLGFAVFMERASERVGDAAKLFRRRLTGLLAIGIVHGVFVWFGDILHVYALLGFALLLFRHAKARTILRWALGFLFFPIVFYVVYVALARAGAVVGPPSGPPPDDILRALDAFARGTYAEAVRANALFLVAGTLIRRFAQFQIPRILGMFLLGLYVYRVGLRSVLADRVRLLRIFSWGLAIGLPTAAFAAAHPMAGFLPEPTMDGLARTTAESIGTLTLSLGYGAGIVLLATTDGLRRLVAPFEPLGRTALSNYLLQSVVCVSIFYGAGLGWFLKTSLSTCLILAVVILAAQMALSAGWLRHFRYGPAEWLWRTFTYRFLQSLRR